MAWIGTTSVSICAHWAPAFSAGTGVSQFLFYHHREKVLVAPEFRSQSASQLVSLSANELIVTGWPRSMCHSEESTGLHWLEWIYVVHRVWKQVDGSHQTSGPSLLGITQLCENPKQTFSGGRLGAVPSGRRESRSSLHRQGSGNPVLDSHWVELIKILCGAICI